MALALPSKSTFEKVYILFEEEAVVESSTNSKNKDVSPNLTLESRLERVINVIKDPALWEINDSVREIIARKGFD